MIVNLTLTLSNRIRKIFIKSKREHLGGVQFANAIANDDMIPMATDPNGSNTKGSVSSGKEEINACCIAILHSSMSRFRSAWPFSSDSKKTLEKSDLNLKPAEG